MVRKRSAYLCPIGCAKFARRYPGGMRIGWLRAGSDGNSGAMKFPTANGKLLALHPPRDKTLGQGNEE